MGIDCIGGTVQSLPADSQRGQYVCVEVKRKAGIDAVEQLTRYRELLDRDPLLNPPIRAILAAQSFTAQAKTLAADRGIDCVVVDYDALRGLDSPEERLF